MDQDDNPQADSKDAEAAARVAASLRMVGLIPGMIIGIVVGVWLDNTLLGIVLGVVVGVGLVTLLERFFRARSS